MAEYVSEFTGEEIDRILNKANDMPAEVVNKAGDTIKGDLTVEGNIKGKYITGTWLQTTADNHMKTKPTKVAILDSGGWVYYRTADEIKSDLGILQKASATLTTSAWNNNAQTVSVSGVTTTNNVIVSPATKASADIWAESEVFCAEQGNGTLKFTCTDVPTADISVNVVIVG